MIPRQSRRSSDAGIRVAGMAPLLLAVAVSPLPAGGSSTGASVGGAGSASGASGAGAVGGSTPLESSCVTGAGMTGL